MATVTYEKGKWIELGKELEKIVRENNSKPKGEKKSLTKLFSDFADANNTTASSTQFYYYNEIKPKMETTSFDDGLDEFIKNTQVDPIYRNVKDVHKIGDIVEGIITSIKDFGAFLKTDEGYEGLIHISQITKEYVTLPEDYFYIGEKVKAKVVRYDGDKLSLSTRAIGGKDRLNPAFKDLAQKKEEQRKIESEVAVAVAQEKEELKTITTSATNNDRDNIINFIKKYSDNNVSPKALGDIADLISEYGVFQTTISLMETVRDLDISSFITEMTKERLEGEYLRQH